MSDPQHLNSAQLQRLQGDIRKQVAAAVDDVKLRQWAVDMACGIINRQTKDSPVVFTNPIDLTKAIYNFVIESAAEVKITGE